MSSTSQLDVSTPADGAAAEASGGLTDDVESILAQAAVRLNEIAGETGVAAADAGTPAAGISPGASSGPARSPADVAQATAASLDDIDAQLADLEAILHESSTAADGLGEATRAAVADAVGAGRPEPPATTEPPVEPVPAAPAELGQTAAAPDADAELEAAIEELDLSAIPSLDEQAAAPLPEKPGPLTIRKTRKPAAGEESVPAASPAGWQLLILRLCRPAAAVLAFLDRPFAGLGAGIKSLIGVVAVSTAAVAAATWIAGAFIRPAE